MPPVSSLPILGVLFGGLLVACAMPGPPPLPTGAEDFAVLCSACHGLDGRGGGELADVLDRKPADLTALSARNGGKFPTPKVLEKIWGYARPDGTTVMPEFGSLLKGDMLRFDAGDGIDTPTPVRLVQLTRHVESLQR